MSSAYLLACFHRPLAASPLPCMPIYIRTCIRMYMRKKKRHKGPLTSSAPVWVYVFFSLSHFIRIAPFHFFHSILFFFCKSVSTPTGRSVWIFCKISGVLFTTLPPSSHPFNHSSRIQTPTLLPTLKLRSSTKRTGESTTEG